jgi:hypothetical protein
MSVRLKRNAKSEMPISVHAESLPKSAIPRTRHRSNLVGPAIAKLRYQRGWRQDDLVAKLQILGCDMTRDVLANIETRRSPVTDTQIDFFCRVFGVQVQDLFPPPCRESHATIPVVRPRVLPARPCRLNDGHA